MLIMHAPRLLELHENLLVTIISGSGILVAVLIGIYFKNKINLVFSKKVT